MEENSRETGRLLEKPLALPHVLLLPSAPVAIAAGFTVRRGRDAADVRLPHAHRRRRARRPMQGADDRVPPACAFVVACNLLFV